jgi:Protein of unknown function (DUF2845)
MFALVTCVPAMAQSLRCDGKIISAGATRAQVTARCGEPVQVDPKSVYYRPISAFGNHTNSIEVPVIEVQVEIWTYNFGPDRLMQRIRFEDGVVVRIESLGYGY